MPDPDRRDVALGALAIIVDRADEITNRDALMFRRELWIAEHRPQKRRAA